MPEVIEVEIHGKEVSDFQLSRLVRAYLRKYTVPITAFISDVAIMNERCVGIPYRRCSVDDKGSRRSGGSSFPNRIQVQQS
ncbi:hypothetical protein ABCR88_29380 [Pseudomonas sp. W17]|uniref:Uncharacterized protein n=1 Tax=Pseudomonas sp. W17 TaxID=3144407 RepID=A0AAU7WTH0_9PSED